MRAGKASLLKTLLVFPAATGAYRLNRKPAKSGTNNNTRFCTISLPTGSSICISLCPDTYLATNSIITGRVKRVITLLNAVNVTDSATSPFASIENTLLELPPGQHAISTIPIKYTGGNLSAQPNANAIAGSIIS